MAPGPPAPAGGLAVQLAQVGQPGAAPAAGDLPAAVAAAAVLAAAAPDPPAPAVAALVQQIRDDAATEAAALLPVQGAQAAIRAAAVRAMTDALEAPPLVGLPGGLALVGPPPALPGPEADAAPAAPTDLPVGLPLTELRRPPFGGRGTPDIPDISMPLDAQLKEHAASSLSTGLLQAVVPWNWGGVGCAPTAHTLFLRTFLLDSFLLDSHMIERELEVETATAATHSPMSTRAGKLNELRR